MPRFKVGDRVRLARKHPRHGDYSIALSEWSRVHTISAEATPFADEPRYRFRKTNSIRTHEWYVFETMLELAEPRGGGPLRACRVYNGASTPYTDWFPESFSPQQIVDTVADKFVQFVVETGDDTARIVAKAGEHEMTILDITGREGTAL